MPEIYDADTYKGATDEQLADVKWFMDKLGVLFWAPSATQESFEENLRILRSVYQQHQMDGTFMQHFARARKVMQDGKHPEFEQAGITVRMVYTADDFLYTEYPYEEIFSETNLFKRDQIMAQLDKQARAVGVRNFKSLYNQYERSQKDHGNKTHRFGVPRADCGELQLDPGDWKMDGTGIYKDTLRGREYACSHSIAPVRRLQNIDTGDEKLTLAYERSGRVRYVTKPKRELFDGAKILDLASVGVAVTSKTGKTLAQYLCEIEGLNYDEIPQQDSVGRLGWLEDGRFSPYVEDVVFDGDAAYGRIFSAIREKGSFDEWLKCAVECRNYSRTAQIMLAASFASVLIRKIGGLSFFVHLWGVDSETGKTVALMLAASVWGSPEIGQYVQTFRSTQVGHEKVAAFLKHIPMCIDEKQLDSKFDVYQLAEGVGKTRGNKAGGIDQTPTWNLSVLTTGETPLTGSGVGAGAVNRVIDIECKNPEKVIEDGLKTSRILLRNHGHAGRRFIEQLTPELLNEADRLHQTYFRELAGGDTTEKQAGAAAMILTADHLADKLIFKTGRHLTVGEISAFLQTRSAVSAGSRGYDYICDWVALNSAKFAGEGTGDSYGLIDGDYAYINRTVFRKSCIEGGYDERALLSWLRANSLILTRGRAFTRGKRINGVNVECVVLKLPGCGVPPETEEDMLL